MKLIYIGKIVNTHGIKGELRLLSSFLEKDLVFKFLKISSDIQQSKNEELLILYRFPHFYCQSQDIFSHISFYLSNTKLNCIMIIRSPKFDSLSI